MVILHYTILIYPRHKLDFYIVGVYDPLHSVVPPMKYLESDVIFSLSRRKVHVATSRQYTGNFENSLVIFDFVSFPIYKPGNEASYCHMYQPLLTYLVQ